jgi:hypothetical protein
VLFDLSHNTLVKLILLNTASVRQPRGVEDAYLGKKLGIPTVFKIPAHTMRPFLLVSS